MNLTIVSNLTFKDKLFELKKYFDDLMKKGVISPMLEDAYKPLKATYDIVFNNEILYGVQEKMATFWPLKEYEEGEAFLNSDIGKLYMEVIFYFATFYKVPNEQMGGYNV